MRRPDLQLIQELDLGNQRLFAASPVLGLYTLPTIPTVGAVLKDTGLKERCVIETIWMAQVTELS